jgi:hypothetical protein
LCRNFRRSLEFTEAMHRRTILAVFVIAAISAAFAASAAARPLADCEPFQARPCAFPFPSDLLTVPDPATVTGLRVRLPGAALPVSNDGVQLRVGPYDDTDGFSPGSTLIVHVPGLDNPQALQETRAAGLQDIGASTSPGQPIAVLDEQTGQRVPIWSELDPVGAPPASTDLVIHPAGSFIEGHTYLVALRSLRTADGELIPAPRWFDRLRAGRPSRAEAGQLPLYRYLFKRLARAGIRRSSLYETWEFTVASSESLTERLLAMRDSAFAALGDPDLSPGGAVGIAPSFQVLSTTPLSAGGQEVSGALQVPCYLKTCGLSSATGFHYSSHAFYAPPTQIPGQFVTAPFECIVPRSASASMPARISLYGHGFLSTAVDVTEPSQQALASAHNFVMCSTDWLGLATGDAANDVGAMLYPNRLPAQVARMQQGVLDMVYLGRLMVSPSGLSSNAAFQQDGESLLDTSQLYYDGNSTGGIQGGIVAAISPDVTRAVLGVSSIDWANWLIPRTQGIGDFSGEQDTEYADLSARPLLLDLMQQIWDRGDPDGYVQHLISDQFPGTLPHQVLMQTAYGDEYVSMYSAAAEARTIGVDAYQPALDPDRSADANLLYGLTPVPGASFAGSAIEIWDLGAGLVRAPPVLEVQPPLDEPPPNTNPHESVQYTPAAQQQISDFLSPAGAFVDVCGGAPCHALGYTP